MEDNCVYKLGEWEPSEHSEDEFFIGYKDCSVPTTGLDCTKQFIYAKPFEQSQWEMDYVTLFNFIKKDLFTTLTNVQNKDQIGKESFYELDFGRQANYLIAFLLLFKEELKRNPTIENYVSLFTKYKIDCVDKHFRGFFNKSWIRPMLKLLEIATLIELPENVYQLDKELDLDPIYYIASL